MKKIQRDFYMQDAVNTAKNLIGKILVRKTKEGITKGIIVETEAYMGETDKAAHSYKAPRSQRTYIQYNEGGYAYIYLIYGMHYCMNIVTNVKDVPHAVLIRALEPVEGIEIMKKRRNTSDIKNLCNGPGKLCKAMAINQKCYGMDLCGDELYLEYSDKKIDEKDITATPRINIDYAEEAKNFPWRFILKDSNYISVKNKKK